MNTAPILSEDYLAQAQALQSRISNLRDKIQKERDLIDTLAKSVRDAQAKDFNAFTDMAKIFKSTFEDMSARFKIALEGTIFSKREKTDLKRMIVELENMTSQMVPPADLFSQAEANSKQGDEENPHSNGFEKDEFVEFIREAKERAKDDPFSPESLHHLKETPENPELRKLYLELAKKLHPDLASNDDDLSRRHDVMQQLTVAYQRRDYSTMLGIKLNNIQNISSHDDIENLKQSVQSLEAQLKSLKKHHSKMKRSETGRFFKERQKSVTQRGETPLESSQKQFNNLASWARDVVLCLEKVTNRELPKEALFELLNNPVGNPFEIDDSDYEDEEADMEMILEMLGEELFGMAEKGKKKRRKKR